MNYFKFRIHIVQLIQNNQSVAKSIIITVEKQIC